MSERTEKTRRLVGMSIFAALVVVLQVAATFIHVGPFPITLALTPIVVGAAVYGPKAGGGLGAVFGAVVLLMSAFGADPGGAILWNVNPPLTALLCLVKGAAAGWAAGAVYTAASRKSMTRGVVLAAAVSPIVNTGIFCAALALLYHGTLVSWAAGANLVYYVFFGLTGVNFLVELAVNAALSPIVARIVRIRMKGLA